jgi:hypothetical protein
LEGRLSNCESSVTTLDATKADQETTNTALMYKADLVLIEEQLKSKAELELVEKKASIKDMTKLLDKKTPLKIFEQTVSVIIEELKTKASETTLEFAYNNLIKANIQILLRWTGSELNNFNLIPWDSEVAN